MDLVRTALMVCLVAAPALAQVAGPGVPLDPREGEIRARYEQVLERNPFQDNAFDRVYEGYMLSEGVDAWLEKLAPAEGESPNAANLVLRGRILARQLKTAEAIGALTAARDQGEDRPELNTLLGRLYYEAGQDREAIDLLSASLDTVANPDERAGLCRILGNVYLRSGKRDEAAATWKRISEAAPNDRFALQELAEIYETNRMWDEAIAAYRRMVSLSEDDPYRRCQSLRAIGQAYVAAEKPEEAIAAFEAAIELAVPGNWLFEDLKGRLVAVYESRGDLDGLAAYLQARVDQNPGALEFAELLAETHLRREDFTAAETGLNGVLARAPERLSAYEMLLRLYSRESRLDEVAKVYERFIGRYPLEPDYLRRLGESYLQRDEPEKAKETWRRVAAEGAGADAVALLAEWFERYEFYPEAAETYARALALRPEREWRLRLAALQFDLGEEDQALATWQSAAAPEDTPAGEMAEIAGVLVTHGFGDAARELYERAMAIDPENLDFVLARARLAADQGDHERAAALYGQLAEQEGNEFFKARGEQGLLDAYTALGTLDAHRAAWERAVEEHPDDTAPRLKLARLYTQSGNRPGAVQLYEACARIEPENIEHQRKLAEAYRHNRQNGEAIPCLQRLMELDPPRAAGYLRDLLQLHEGAQQREEAIAAAEKLVEMTPSSPESRSELAKVYLRQGQQEKALQQFRNAIQLDGDEPAHYRDLGDALARAEHPGEAREVYRKMLETARDKATRLDAVNKLTAVHARTGEGAAMVAEFQERVRATPKNLAAYEELAAVYGALGEQEAAMETLESARGNVEDTASFLRLVLAEAYTQGDYGRVVSASEELLALSGEPTAYELDRLAEAYARSGDLDKAVAVWKRVSRENGKDPAVQVLVAKALQRYGYYEDARPYLEKALELDPYDYRLRFEFANQLLSLDDTGEAARQLRLILEIGERPAAADGNAAAQNTVAPSGATPVPSGGLFGVQFGGRRALFGAGRVAGGTFAEFRASVIQSIVQAARLTGGTDDLIAEFQKKIEDDPSDTDARFTYLLVCEHAGRDDLALEAAGELRAIYPEDLPLQWQILELQRELDLLDDAIQTAVTLAENAGGDTARRAELILIGLYIQNGQPEQADAAITRLTADRPEDAEMYLQLAYTVRSSDRADEAIAFLKKAAELDSNRKGQINDMLARLYKQRGEIDDARALFAEVLFSKPQPLPASGARQPPRNTLYMPDLGRGRPRASGLMARLPNANFLAFDRQKSEAFNQILQMTLEDGQLAPLLEQVRQKAEAYAVAENAEDARYAASYVQIYTAYLRNTDETETALDALQAMADRKPNDALLNSLMLYLLDDLGRYSEMDAIYDAMEQENAASAVEFAQARLHLAMAQEDFDAVPDRYRALAASGGAPQYLGLVIHALNQAGAADRAIELLEEAAAKSRDPDILTQLSQAYTGKGEYEKAIELAWEAWQAQSAGGGQRAGRLQYTQGDLSLQSLGQTQLFPLWNAYRQAGRSGDLLDAFREKLAGQPSSLSLRLALVALYCQDKQLDQALGEMETLAALRPSDPQYRLPYASLLEATGDKAGALRLLEETARGRMRNTRNLTPIIQRLYKELNKTEELAAMRERMVQEARTAGQLSELAQNLASEGAYGEAVELMERAYRMEPENIWLLYSAGDYRWAEGRHGEALDTYVAFLKRSAEDPRTPPDMRRMPAIIERFDGEGRLDELKAIAGASQSGGDPRGAVLLGALIALHEARYEAAEAQLQPLLKDEGDTEVRDLLADIAEKRGDLDGAIAYIEKAPAQGQPDAYRRLAALYLKKGDTGRAVDSWKKLAELRGGYRGHEEAARALIQARELDAAEAYFREVFDKIPAGDRTFRQLATIVVQEYVRSGAFAALADGVIFAKDSPDTAELVQTLTADYQRNPKAAYQRVASIADRFPENEPVQIRLAEILDRLGDYGGAVDVYQRVLTGDEQRTQYYQPYVSLLTRAGRIGDCVAFARAWLEEKSNPTSEQIRRAAETVRATGDAGALRAMRAAVLAKTDPGQRARVEADFAWAMAQIGDVAGSRAILKARYEAQPARQTMEEYFTFLQTWGYYDEANAFYEEAIGPEIRNLLTPQNAAVYTEPLIACGNVEEACELTLLAWQRDDNAVDPIPGGGMQALIRQLRDYNASARGLQGLVARLREKAALSISERLFLASYDANMGNLDGALEWIALDSNDYRIRQALQMLLNAATEDQRAKMLDRLAGGHVAPEVLLETGLARARSAIAAGKMDEAVTLLDGIQIPPEFGNYALQRANLYLEAEALDKARKASATVLDREPGNARAGAIVAVVLARTGDVEGALGVWRDLPNADPGMAYPLALALVEQKQYGAAREILADIRFANQPDPNRDLLAARVLHESGQDNAIVAEMESRREAFYNNREAFEAAYGDFLMATGLWRESLAALGPEAHPALAGALLHIARVLPGEGNGEERTRLVNALAGSPLNYPSDAVALAQLLRDLDRKPEALDVLRRIAPLDVTQSWEVTDIVQGFIAMDAWTDAAAALNTLSARFPEQLKRPDNIIRIAARAGDAPPAAELFERLQSTGYGEIQEQYNRARLAYEKDGPEAGLERYEALVDAPGMNGDSLLHMAAAFRENGRTEAALRALERVCASDEFGSNVSDRAAAEAVQIHAAAGRPMEAIRLFARLLPARRESARDAYAAIVEHAAEVPLAEADPFLLDTVKAAPAHPRVSELLALRSKLAALQGTTLETPDLDALGVPPEEIYETDLWTNRIDAWRISGPVDNPDGGAMAAPLDETTAVVLRGDPVADVALEQWTATRPGDVYATVPLARLIKPAEGGAAENCAAYCATEIVSPDERQVTFAHGSGGWSRVWVNGAEVFTSRAGRICLIDQDQFPASLRAGANRVVVECANRGGDWEFSLSVIEGGDGLTARLPQPAPAPEP